VKSFAHYLFAPRRIHVARPLRDIQIPSSDDTRIRILMSFFGRNISRICGMRELSGSHGCDALYQGTTLVGP
jgi:hypothetical protein